MNERSLQKIDNVIDIMSDLVERWAGSNCPHHAAEAASALAELLKARAEWEKAR